MNRRQFILKAALTSGSLVLFGCGRDGSKFIARGARDERKEVTLYDTYAQALYMDGTQGPKTGTIKVDYIVASQPVVLDFWHGHGGKIHKFTLTQAHYDDLKKLKRVYVTTNEVEGHTHKLFIDPVDTKWRVPGAKPVVVTTPDRDDTVG